MPAVGPQPQSRDGGTYRASGLAAMPAANPDASGEIQ